VKNETSLLGLLPAAKMKATMGGEKAVSDLPVHHSEWRDILKLADFLPFSFLAKR
jgi:hypothetical protein